MTSRIYIALDTTDIAVAKTLVNRVRHHVGGVKLGLEFFCAHGQAGVREIASLGLPIFLDLKLHDIPNTVAKAVRALAPLDPAILTVHASGGRAMLEDAKASAPPHTKVVAVTMLTSLDSADMVATGIAGSPHDQVVRLAELARDSGVDGIVCSGEEVAAAKAAWPKGFFVVPGVRLADDAIGDQKRVVTPRAAVDAGASILVIGRPITRAEDPDLAARAIGATL
jgi:orotidine-5'-phosphate decarboxylase